MKPEPLELTWAQVHAFRLERHHLVRRAAKAALSRVVGEICGVQAQVMSAAELQIGTRVDCRVQDVREALWKNKTLVKTWLMRGTLHLVPAEDLPLFTAAMSTRWIRPTNAWLEFYQLSEPEFKDMIEAIGRALDGHVLTREELVEKACAGRPQRIRDAMRSGWGGMLKPVARSGLLCFGPSRGQGVTFVRPQQWLGAWRDVDPDEAVVEIARRYLRAYGPATTQDFNRWWGGSSGVGKLAWSGLAGELISVAVDGRRADLLSSDAKQIAKQPNESSVQLLPAFDPYLMGHSSRSHLVEAEHLSRVSRTAGWISAVVLVDGRATATWTHKSVKDTLLISVEPFHRLTAKTISAVRRKVEALADTLGMSRVEVRVV